MNYFTFCFSLLLCGTNVCSENKEFQTINFLANKKQTFIVGRDLITEHYWIEIDQKTEQQFLPALIWYEMEALLPDTKAAKQYNITYMVKNGIKTIFIPVNRARELQIQEKLKTFENENAFEKRKIFSHNAPRQAGGLTTSSSPKDCHLC